jgi:hypothetical protein
MRRFARAAIWSGLGVLALIAASVVAFGAALRGMCGNEELSSIPAPDGRLRAVVFQRDCGATTGYSRQLSVLGAAEALPNEAGNVLAFGDRGQPDPNAPWVGPQLRLTWVRGDTLLIRTNSSMWREHEPARVRGVTVLFRTLERGGD